MAELGSNFFLSFCGIDSTALFDNSASYFNAWLNRISSNPSLLLQASSQAQKRFDVITLKLGVNTAEKEPQTEETLTE